MLIYLGGNAVKHVATKMEFAEMLTPIEAIKKAAAQKTLPLFCSLASNYLQDLRAIGTDDTKRHHDYEDYWNDDQLDIGRIRLFRVSREVVLRLRVAKFPTIA